ncbi:MAG TPA: serine/threonine-protein kinase [Gemmatimonadaceae bacterium]|nr:serine/threonine-protein kinase [Gemmatimonadaceae bacterium]
MDAERWGLVQTLFHGASDLSLGERRTFLDAACPDDPELLAEVEALLDADERGVDILERGVADVARVVLGDDANVLGQRVGRYRLIRVIGEGGMGIVYLAERDTEVGGQVAIKILRDAWLSPARRERFANEQRTLAQLTHPSIARFYDADTLADGTPWFAMEYVEGMPLTAHCTMRGCSITERLRLFRIICEAVQYAHRHLVIHRDLKPSNILVRPDGSVALLDFGIAKQIEGLGTPVDHTRTGLRFMTPAYAAPEQLRGDRAGVQTDVYSLGVVLYELLTERLPFDLAHRTPGEAQTIILEHDPVKPSAVAKRVAERSGIPAGAASWADLDVLCLTAMHKDPERRYQSVEALMRDVDHYVKDQPLEARTDSMRYRAVKFVRRHRRPVAALGVVMAVVVGLTAIYTVGLAHARNAAVAEAARTQRVQRFMLSLLDGGDENEGPSDSLRVLTMVDRGVREARALDREPAIQAALYTTLGGVYQQLGNLERADSLLRAGLDERRSLYGADHAEIAESLVLLGLLRVDQARLTEAESFVRQGLAMALRVEPANDPSVGRATAALGYVLRNRGEKDSALRVLQGAARIQSDSADLSETLTSLANTYYDEGQYAVADSINRRVLALDRVIHGDRHPSVATDLTNLGAIEHDLGHYPLAEGFYRQAIDIDQAWYGANHPETVSLLPMLARTLIAEKRYPEAVGMLQEALVIQEKVYGAVHPRVASVLNALGLAALAQGDLDGAEGDFTRMGAIYRSVYGEQHYTAGITASDLGSVYAKRQDYPRAERSLRDAIRRLTDAQGADHLNTGVARIKLGEVLLADGRLDDARRESLAGYGIVAKQPGTGNTWLLTAQKDVAAESVAMNRKLADDRR